MFSSCCTNTIIISTEHRINTENYFPMPARVFSMSPRKVCLKSQSHHPSTSPAHCPHRRFLLTLKTLFGILLFFNCPVPSSPSHSLNTRGASRINYILGCSVKKKPKGIKKRKTNFVWKTFNHLFFFILLGFFPPTFHFLTKICGQFLSPLSSFAIQ